MKLCVVAQKVQNIRDNSSELKTSYLCNKIDGIVYVYDLKWSIEILLMDSLENIGIIFVMTDTNI